MTRMTTARSSFQMAILEEDLLPGGVRGATARPPIFAGKTAIPSRPYNWTVSRSMAPATSRPPCASQLRGKTKRQVGHPSMRPFAQATSRALPHRAVQRAESDGLVAENMSLICRRAIPSLNVRIASSVLDLRCGLFRR